MDLILASASPRRRELMGYFGLPFDIVPAAGPETPPAGADAAHTAEALALAKAKEIAESHPGAVVIGADTVVEIEGVILGKPKDEEDARRMLRMLSGREHRVYTGLAVIYGDKIESCAECTRVHFRPMTGAEIDDYIATGEPMDKAGAYGYQGRAGMYVEKIEGDFFNVVGLPLCLLGNMLSEAGVKLH